MKSDNCAEIDQQKTAPKHKKKARVSPDQPICTQRLEQLLSFDRQVLTADRKVPAELIIGTDEVGRGCLAGPVVACAVIMPVIECSSPEGLALARLNDSKLVHPAARSELSAILRGLCRFAIGQASVEEIDEINVLQASLLAMRRAIRRLQVVSPAVILLDGNQRIKSLRNIEQITVIGGDSKSASIAAASIIAKVHRDAFMTKLAKRFPHYRWDSNKGYGSPDHWSALTLHGMSKWHRRSFVEHSLKGDDPTRTADKLTAELRKSFGNKV